MLGSSGSVQSRGSKGEMWASLYFGFCEKELVRQGI